MPVPAPATTCQHEQEERQRPMPQERHKVIKVRLEDVARRAELLPRPPIRGTWTTEKTYFEAKRLHRSLIDSHVRCLRRIILSNLSNCLQCLDTACDSRKLLELQVAAIVPKMLTAEAEREMARRSIQNIRRGDSRPWNGYSNEKVEVESLSTLDSNPPDPWEGIDPSEFMEVLRQISDERPELKEKIKIHIHRYYDGKSQREIGEMTGKTEDAVRKVLERSRDEIRKAVALRLKRSGQ